MVVVSDVFEEVEEEFFANLFGRELGHIGAEDPEPDPEACGDDELGDEGPLEEPGCEAVQVPILPLI